jgi:hypothetical protein
VPVFGKLKAVWRRWRESRRQYAIERALYKSGGGRQARRMEPGRMTRRLPGDEPKSWRAAKTVDPYGVGDRDRASGSGREDDSSATTKAE